MGYVPKGLHQGMPTPRSHELALKHGLRTEAPRFHYGILLTEKQIHYYGRRSRLRLWKEDPGVIPERFKVVPLSQLTIDHVPPDGLTFTFELVIWGLNERLKKQNYGDIQCDRGDGMTLELSSKIVSFVFTGAQEHPKETDPIKRWPDEDRLHKAVDICKKALEEELVGSDSEVPEARWYFCREGFSPNNFYNEPYNKEVVLQGLVDHLPTRN
ncbi:hypothetical protein C8Q76DRAFT_786664 [Earliella scabrosa]|nr:hypothetical protein C8Q76DRAFT_786664 [Earliella scabrosa]